MRIRLVLLFFEYLGQDGEWLEGIESDRMGAKCGTVRLLGMDTPVSGPNHQLLDARSIYFSS